jgi:hypothetical protein
LLVQEFGPQAGETGVADHTAIVSVDLNAVEVVDNRKMFFSWWWWWWWYAWDG